MTILAKLQPIDIAIIIAVPSAILIGLLMFFFAGLHHPRKNYAIIIEKARAFHCVYDQGFHFKMPIVYQRVGTYCIVPQTRTYLTNNGNNLDVTFQIEDVKTYHYAPIKFNDIMRKIEKENSEINLTILTETFNKYGLKFINIKKSLI